MTEGLHRLQFARRDGGRAGVDREGQSGDIARLAVGRAGELLAVAERKFDLETSDVLADQRDRIQVQVGAEQNG